tara:strand:- start:540 stop:1187 length:648 start_codon:yes stop_codon:yes gene_type:complete
MRNFLNKEFFNRFISVIIFVPLVLFPLIYSKYLSLFIYTVFYSIIFLEIESMKVSKQSKRIYNYYSLLTILSFLLFIFLLITTDKNNYVLIEIILIIWLFDTFSYLGGRIIGGKKLMPNISPGKTISGLISGIICTFFIVGIFKNFIYEYSNVYFLFTLTIIFLAFLGDMLVSILKRYSNLKDTGYIMPGHGGLLDRFDSFIFVFFGYGIFKVFI